MTASTCGNETEFITQFVVSTSSSSSCGESLNCLVANDHDQDCAKSTTVTWKYIYKKEYYVLVHG